VPPKGTIAYSKTGKFNISKLTNSTIKWSGLKNLDLAEKVTTSKNYIWKGLKTWKKETGYKKNSKEFISCSCNRLWNKEKYFKIFFRL
jgi:carbamoyl-phosphate synthase small subunit